MRRALLAAVLALCLSGCELVPIPQFEPPASVQSSTAPGAGGSVVGGALAEYLTTHGRRVTVTRIVDGDTIAVTGDERVRLLTVDAPELHANTRADDADCGAVEARDALASQTPVGAEVVLDGLKGEPRTDRYDRTLANVYVPLPSKPGAYGNVSLWLVEQGRARVFEAYPTSDTAAALKLQDYARTARLGLWGSCPVPA